MLVFIRCSGTVYQTLCCFQSPPFPFIVNYAVIVNAAMKMMEVCHTNKIMWLKSAALFRNVKAKKKTSVVRT